MISFLERIKFQYIIENWWRYKHRFFLCLSRYCHDYYIILIKLINLIPKLTNTSKIPNALNQRTCKARRRTPAKNLPQSESPAILNTKSLTSVPGNLAANDAKIARCPAWMHTVEGSLLALCPAACPLTVTFVFEGAWTRGCVELAVLSRPREERVARSDYQGHCLCFIRPLSACTNRHRVALNFQDVRACIDTHIRAHTVAFLRPRCASCDATTQPPVSRWPVRGIRDVFMSKLETPTWFRIHRGRLPRLPPAVLRTGTRKTSVVAL